MAILDHFDVTVEVEGKTSREYQDEDLDATVTDRNNPTVARYIEAQNGQTFGVRIRVGDGYHFMDGSNCLACAVYIDGNFMESRIARATAYVERGSLDTLISNKRSGRGGRWLQYPFTFWDLDITQESIKGDAEKLKSKFESLGMIEARIMSYYSLGSSDKADDRNIKNASDKSVPEKVLKGRAVTLGAGLGDGVPARAINTHTGFYVSPEPLARFFFHYRSKKSLQDLMILPKDDLENKSAEELRVMLRQARAVQTPIKSELESKRILKREAVPYQVDDDILEVREVKKKKVVLDEVIEIDSD